MTPCQLCRGACCESIVTSAPPTDSGFWLSLHGNTLADGRLELPVRCHALAKCGSCSIHSMRPEHCRNFPVGGADCRATVLRRRPSEASAIFAAMPGFATSVADSAKRGQSAGAEPGTYPGPAAAGNGA